VAGQLFVLVIIMGCIGAFYGALSPALAAMTGLEAPGAVKATVFGLSASAGAIGSSIGPVACGFLASTHGLAAGLGLSGASVLVVGLLLATVAREPLPA
jgi:hypothetical protein